MTARSNAGTTPLLDGSPLPDSSSSPDDSPSLISSLIGDEHLWSTLKLHFGCEGEISPAAGAAWSSFGAMVLGAVFCLVVWSPSYPEPGLEPTTWTAIWWEGGQVYLSFGVLFVVDWIFTIFLLWPFGAILSLIGIAIFVTSHGAVAFAILLPLSLLYSTYSTRTFPLSSLLFLSFDSPFARLVDYLPLPACLHIIFAFAIPSGALPSALPILYVVDLNAALLVLRTSLPCLLAPLFALCIENDKHTGRGWRSGADLEAGPQAQLEEMRKEIERLQGMVNKA
jgi:hypothetical protein